jgi:DNA-binding response OmpR family regulator
MHNAAGFVNIRAVPSTAGLARGRRFCYYRSQGETADDMSFPVAILASTHLVRQSVAQCLAPLGFRVHEFTDLAELALGVNRVAPRLVVVDIDGLEGKWQPLAAALRGSAQRLPLVLLAGRFGFEEAHEALSLGVAGMILKPFQKEEHTGRLVELVLKSRGLRPRRASPRFLPPEEAPVGLRYLTPDGGQRAQVADLSLGGLGVSSADAGRAAGLPPGARLDQAVLQLETGEVPLSARVVHHSAGRMGLQVLRLFEGRAAFLRVVEVQHARAFGPRGKRNRW